MTQLTFQQLFLSVRLLSAFSSLEWRELGEHFPSFLSGDIIKSLQVPAAHSPIVSGVSQQQFAAAQRRLANKQVTADQWSAWTQASGQSRPAASRGHKANGEKERIYLLALVESLAAVLLEILASFFLG